MWARKTENKESLLKEALLRQLSHAVKEVQLYHSQTGEECTVQEGTLSLVTVLEAIFLHGLKRTLFESARRTISTTDDSKPSPAFYPALRSVTNKNTDAQIFAQQRVTTDVGRSRAWIRLALNDWAVSSYLSAVSHDKKITRYYHPSAFLRDKESLDTAANLVHGLVNIPFNIPLNSSLLNVWSSEPLLMSGLWSPALRETVQVALDVAGGIEDEETCSLLTTSSSMRSLIMMDEAQALQMILEATVVPEEDEPKNDDMHVTLADEMKEEEEMRKEEKKVMERTFSSLLESVSPKDNDSPIAVATNPFEDDSALEEDDGKVEMIPSESPPVPQIQVEDFSKIVSEFNNENESSNIFNLYGIKRDKEENKKKTVEETVQKIQRELGLKLQNFECADCRLSIGLNFGRAQLCSVTGDYLCDGCHTNDVGVVPARIIYNWDHSKYPIGKRAMTFLTSNYTKPLFNFEELNPQIYNAVPDLKEILRTRRQLSLLNIYLTTCKETVNIEARDYLHQSVHKYSLSDLVGIPGGALKVELGKLVSQARNHVIDCWMCKQKGFICELCKDPQVIYPFDAGSVYRCSKCNAVYHGQCLTKGKSCPKCQRRKTRESKNEKE